MFGMKLNCGLWNRHIQSVLWLNYTADNGDFTSDGCNTFFLFHSVWTGSVVQPATCPIDRTDLGHFQVQWKYKFCWTFLCLLSNGRCSDSIYTKNPKLNQIHAPPSPRATDGAPFSCPDCNNLLPALKVINKYCSVKCKVAGRGDVSPLSNYVQLSSRKRLAVQEAVEEPDVIVQSFQDVTFQGQAMIFFGRHLSPQ